MAFKLGGREILPIREPTEPLRPREIDPASLRGSLERGKEVMSVCSDCHAVPTHRGLYGVVGTRMDLRFSAYIDTDEGPDLALKNGLPGVGMPAFPRLSRDDVASLRRYIASKIEPVPEVLEVGATVFAPELAKE